MILNKKSVELFAFLVAMFGLSIISMNANADTVPVKIVNDRTVSVYVSFTTKDHSAGPITWNVTGAGCKHTGVTGTAAYTKINPGGTCIAKVNSNAGSSRFCAALDKAPKDCMNGQSKNLTLIETTFESSTNKGCFGKGSCVWYDISVIPSNCTDSLWKANQCANTGGASYNLPVKLQCSGNKAMPTYICQGPQNNTYGPANYPSKCGNPNATCAVGTFPHGKACVDGVSTYFYPMFQPPESNYQPNAVCLKGTLEVSFLKGS